MLPYDIIGVISKNLTLKEFQDIKEFINIPDRYFQGNIFLKRSHTIAFEPHAHKELIYRYEILRQRYPLANFHLDLSYTNIKDLTPVENVYGLNLSCCMFITNESLLELKKTRDLAICYTQITDVSELNGLKTLDIQGTEVTDISSLKNVQIKSLVFTPIQESVDYYEVMGEMEKWKKKYRKSPLLVSA